MSRTKNKAETTPAVEPIAIEDQSDWVIQTATGRMVDLRTFDVGDVDLMGDVAAGLSRIGRFLGHTREFYSVAQHCVIASVAVERVLYQERNSALDDRPMPPHALLLAARLALLHDAHEAYLGDVPTPIKRFGVTQRWRELAGLVQEKIEQRCLDQAALDRAGLARLLVARTDARLLGTEKRDLLRPAVWTSPPDMPVQGLRIVRCLSPDEARRAWIMRFDALWTSELVARPFNDVVWRVIRGETAALMVGDLAGIDMEPWLAAKVEAAETRGGA